MTRWASDQTSDSSILELFRFDFKTNPRLRLTMVDQDSDDQIPYDNRTDYFDTNAATVARRLIKARTGTVLAVWNGLFHGYDRTLGGPPEGYATHIGPNVIEGKARYNFGSVRWAFGVKQTASGPVFSVLHEPTIKEMAAAMTYGAIGAQCLVLDGKPLKLQSPTRPGDPPLKTPVPCGPDEAGHIPGVDFLKTSRTSLAWSKDNRFLYLLLVNEPDNELASKQALRFGDSTGDGGWALRDLQRFWISFGADFAINSDGGIVAQLVQRREDGRYVFSPPRWVAPREEVVLGKEAQGGPTGGGTLMSFAVIEVRDRP